MFYSKSRINDILVIAFPRMNVSYMYTAVLYDKKLCNQSDGYGDSFFFLFPYMFFTCNI